jgi:hypothetical protein
MPLTATSTLNELRTAYVDNAGYAQSGSVAAAQEFAAACRWLLLRVPEESGNRDGDVKMNTKVIEDDLKRVEAWLAANAPAPEPAAGTARSDVRLVGFNYGRD